MVSTGSGVIPLFRVAGIRVYLHWSWILMAIYQAQQPHDYDSPLWKVAEYLTLFVIVLLHEFGHAFATRSVGGESREILLWPFGGIAFVRVPPRPAAELWSIAAGPLVNVILVPVLIGIAWTAGALGWTRGHPDFGKYLVSMFEINLWLILFNVLPIYPLDGGQILRSLLWFPLGRVRSLQIASVLGFIGLPFLAWWGFRIGQPIFLTLMAVFLGQQCLRGFRHAKSLAQLERLPRRPEFACPVCQQSPPEGNIWLCGQCRQPFDAFRERGVCPHCATALPIVTCAFCGAQHALGEWEKVKHPPGTPPVIDV